MLSWFSVFIGGGLGSLCRYGLGLLLPSGWLPWGTLAANVLACWVLGAVLGAHKAQPWGGEWKLLVGTGFCGGFSTFSTLVSEADALDTGRALGYVGASLVAGWLALTLGWWCGRQLSR